MLDVFLELEVLWLLKMLLLIKLYFAVLNNIAQMKFELKKNL